MFPMAMMPDPDAGLRLTKLGAKVNLRKGTFKKPVKVHGPEDWQNPESKKAKMAEHEIWLVTIDMPLKYINHGLDELDDIIAQDIEATNAALADAYEEMPEQDMGMDQTGMDQGGMGGDPSNIDMTGQDQQQPPQAGGL